MSHICCEVWRLQLWLSSWIGQPLNKTISEPRTDSSSVSQHAKDSGYKVNYDQVKAFQGLYNAIIYTFS